MTFNAFFSSKRRFFWVKFLLNAAVKHLRIRRLLRGQRLLEGGVYFTFPFPNAVFIGERQKGITVLAI